MGLNFLPVGCSEKLLLPRKAIFSCAFCQILWFSCLIVVGRGMSLIRPNHFYMDPYWQLCANYGRIDIQPRNGEVKLYYNQFEYRLLIYPRYFKASSAMWQGSNVIVRGYNQYNEPKAVLMTDFVSYQQL